MAKEYGQRPSSLYGGRVGDLALDLLVFQKGSEIDVAIGKAVTDNPKVKDAHRLVIDKLVREAEMESRGDGSA